MANQIKYQVGFDVHKEGLNQLKSSLQQLQKMKISDLMKINKTDYDSASTLLGDIKNEAVKVEDALKKAFNVKLEDNMAFLPGVVSRKKQVVPNIDNAI